MRNGLIEYPDGTKYYFKDDVLHREDDPAVEYGDGTKVWYKYGKRHREEGAAIEYAYGKKTWWINHKELTESQFKEWQIQNRKNKIEALDL